MGESPIEFCQVIYLRWILRRACMMISTPKVERGVKLDKYQQGFLKLLLKMKRTEEVMMLIIRNKIQRKNKNKKRSKQMKRMNVFLASKTLMPAGLGAWLQGKHIINPVSSVVPASMKLMENIS